MVPEAVFEKTSPLEELNTPPLTPVIDADGSIPLAQKMAEE